MPQIALSYHTGKQHYQNSMPLNEIITDISLFSMQISIYPNSERFELVITPYLKQIGYVVKQIQVTSYHVRTEFCCYGCCQGRAASLTYIVTKLNEHAELDVPYGPGTSCKKSEKSLESILRKECYTQT